MLPTRLEDPRRLADARYNAEPKLDGQRAQPHIREHRTVHASQGAGRVSGLMTRLVAHLEVGGVPQLFAEGGSHHVTPQMHPAPSDLPKSEAQKDRLTT
jgi:hypothetical protein